jgi:class 3 adenylate cyclase/streptogramin lyase
VPKSSSNVLRAVVFTDVVGSTELARELGDQRWSRLLAAQRRVIRDQLKTHGGHEVDTAGDGFFATFEGPADAVRCAFAAVQHVQDLGLDIRAGVHFGEVELVGGSAHGIVVHTGARVMAQAGPAEVLITQTVRDLVAGARFSVAERGVFDLKGVPGRWTLFDVLEVDEQPRPKPVEDATVASERRERASAQPPQSRPRWIVPGIVAVVVTVIGLGFMLSRPQHHVPGPGSVARIDGDRFDEPIQVGSFPLALAEGDGRVWVMDRQSQIYWVNERDDSTGSRGTDGVPTDAVIGDGAVWITAAFGTGAGANGAVTRLDPTTGQVATAFDTPIGSDAIAFGGGAIWVADANAATVTRYDPVTQRNEAISLPKGDPAASPDSLAYGELGGEAVWVGDRLSPKLYRMDAVGSHAVHTYSVGGPPTAVTVGRDAVWVASERNDSVFAVDPTSGSVRTSIDVGSPGCNGPVSIAAEPNGGVWVACSSSQSVIRIDADGTIGASLPVEGVPVAVTTAQDGSVWVAVQSS